MIRLFLTLFALAVLASCSEHSLTNNDKEAVITDVHRTIADYHQSIKREGLLAEFKYLDTSADFFWVPPGYIAALSYDSVAAILRAQAPMLRSVIITMDTLRIIPLSKDLAIYTARIQSNTTDTIGTRVQALLIETGTFIKRKDGWKLFSGQTSLIK
jgi:hypothetical protein